MRISSALFIAFALAFLFTASSCKKEKQVTCTLSSVNLSGQVIYLEYDANGFETKRTDSATHNYQAGTVSGNILTVQNYTGAGVPTGTPKRYVLNTNGTIAQSIDVDTLFYTYNADGYLTRYTRGSGANLNQSNDFTIENGNPIYVIQRDGTGHITYTTHITYNDKPNKAHLNLVYNLLSDARYGKASANLIDKVENSDGTALSTSNIVSEYNDNGYPVLFNILRQPGNSNDILYFGYSCN